MPAYALTFGLSPSPNYERVVAIARTVVGYRAEGGDRNLLHVVPVDSACVGQLEQLVALTGNWRSLSLTANGIDTGRRHIWALLRALRCYRGRCVGGLEELHCWGLPGARRGRLPCRLIDRRLPWLLEGEYANPAVLPQLLGAFAREAMVEVCPAFDLGAVQEAALEQLQPGAEQDRRGLQAGLVFGLRLLSEDRVQPEPNNARSAQDERELLSRLLRDVDLGEPE
jgi:hypothetical protein